MTRTAVEELWVAEDPLEAVGKGDFISQRSQLASPLLWKNTRFTTYLVMVFKGH